MESLASSSTPKRNIFLAGAHTEGAPLPELVDEIRAIERMLQPLHQRKICTLLSNRAANLEDVFSTFSRESGQIAVFHYAGHANQQELHLEGGGHARGIAELFGLTQGAGLQLVFLNGCASSGQVTSLHAAAVGIVIATNRSIGDWLAREFAEHFYQTWAMEGKTLEQAFQTAVAFIHSKPEEKDREIKVETRSFGRTAGEEQRPVPWGLYLNPQLAPEAQQKLLGWVLQPSVELPPQIVEKMETATSESLRKVAFEFCNIDADARQMVEQERCSELMALIIRLPWTVGTHVRRLFAVDKGKTMTQSGLPRLREIGSGYTELTRFICYTALSALWEDMLNYAQPVKFQVPDVLPETPDGIPPDYIFHLKEYHRVLREIPGDVIRLEAGIEAFLNEVNGRLQSAYHFMERLKDALAQVDKSEILDNFIANNGPKEGLDEVCRKAEAIFGQFIKAAFFLTQYTLYSVRAISVDKVRYLNLEDPYVHKTITLHAAFGEPKAMPTKRKVAGDNYSILLAPRAGTLADPLENALNLSPFYIDKHALMGDKRDHYPAIFVLKNKMESYREETFSSEIAYAYEYLDVDVNHRYLSPQDHRLGIADYGLKMDEKDGIGLKEEDNLRFREIYKQIEKLNRDFHIVV